MIQSENVIIQFTAQNFEDQYNDFVNDCKICETSSFSLMEEDRKSVV
jgi:hypothetical protein